MTAHSLGYAWIQEQLGAPDFLGPRRARVAAVQSLQRLPEGALLVPPRLAPTPRWLDQALFAIKHEGVHLGYLAGALRQVDDATLREAVALTPNGDGVVCVRVHPPVHGRQRAAVTLSGAHLHLRQEVAFLGLFDEVARHINARHDLRGSDLATLIVTAFQNGGTLSNNRRKRFADRVQPAVLEDIEAAVARRMRGEPLEDKAQD